MNETDDLKEVVKKCTEQLQNMTTYFAAAMKIVQEQVEQVKDYVQDINKEVQSCQEQPKQAKKAGRPPKNQS